jgi:hypothetical protein
MTIRLNSSTSGYTELDAPAIGGNNTLRLPGDNGTSGYLMQTDGSGNLSWCDPSSLLSPYRNRVINGDMRIDQRNAGAAVSISNNTLWPVDRFPVSSVCDGVISGQRSSVAPAGFTNSLLITVTTADATIGATQYNMIRQVIEGFNVADLGWGSADAQTVTLSFWVRSSVTGTFGGAVQNASENRAYAFTYSIAVANTWEKKTITIPGDTTGTWAKDNTQGMIINWSLGVGTTYSSTANSWAAQSSFSATGSTALLNTLNATFYITGVQLEAGTVATPFERRNYAQELSLCQRYFQLAGNGCFGSVDGSSTSVIAFAERFFVPMRTAPTVVWKTGGTANWRYAGGDISNGGTSSLANTISTVNAVWSQQGGFSGLTANLPVFSRNQTSTGEFLACSAEL